MGTDHLLQHLEPGRIQNEKPHPEKKESSVNGVLTQKTLCLVPMAAGGARRTIASSCSGAVCRSEGASRHHSARDSRAPRLKAKS